MGEEWRLVLVMLLVLSPVKALKWQGTGNLNNGNLTVIWTYINNNFRTSWTFGSITWGGDATMINFATGLSDYLNGQWDPAWNVFVTYIGLAGANADTVVYGYAFRDRWMWYNGVKMDDDYYVAFIIWKDYNCITWYSYYDTDNSLRSSTYGFPGINLQSAINDFQSSASSQSSDVWKSARALSSALEVATGFSGTAFTIILC